MGVNVSDLILDHSFLDVTPKHRNNKIKKKIDKLDFFTKKRKKKTLCFKEYHQKSEGGKKRPSKWGEINANQTSTKGYICSIYRELRQSNNKNDNPTKKE